MSTSTLTASCYCGSIAFEVADVSAEDIPGIICHCRTCQKLHTFQSYNAQFKKEQLKVTKGEPNMYDDTGANSGYTIHRAFCGKCGSALYSYPESAPDAVFVKAGVLDELARVKPAAEIFVERAIKGTSAECAARKTKLFEGMMAKEI